MKSLYLLINLFAFGSTFVLSFEWRVRFYKRWKYYLPAIILGAAPFLIWDAYFVVRGIWGFNMDYLLGFSLGNLPVEEVLFFFCIPYSCLFIYEAVHFFKLPKLSLPAAKTLNLLLAFCALIALFFCLEKTYTAWTFAYTFLISLAVHRYFLAYMDYFWWSFAFSLLPFFIVNGLLTGTGLSHPIVWYNNAENLSIRLGTIPVEDVSYSYNMLLTIFLLSRYFLRVSTKATT
jgi:lycopene cyclase domain-containing protein